MSSDPAAAAEVAIGVRGLSKCYHIYARPQDRLRQSLLSVARGIVGGPPPHLYREFWALNDVSFDVHKGETVGVIGRNGSGKSTLLQLVCGTLAPTSGEVRTNGRIAALLELGSGFNPDFTGRDNVFMNGAILGVPRSEIEARFDDIAAFAGIGDFIDQPVKTYSSGMFVRLAFAVNIMSRPSIMIVDEALAVGDMNFQAKCMTALRRIQEDGATVLFVSHDIGAVKSLCSRAIYLDGGKVIATGPAAEVADRYVRDMREEMNEEHRKAAPARVTAVAPARADPGGAPGGQGPGDAVFKESAEFDARVAHFRYGSGEARIAYAELVDRDGNALVSATFDQEALIRIYFVSHTAKTIAPAYYIQDDKKMMILGAGPRQSDSSFIAAGEGERFVATYGTRLPLQEGVYSIQLQLTEPVVPDATARFLDVIEDAIVFRVERREAGRVWAKVLLPNSLRIESAGRAQ
jgi:lipopolysaccharide transport system ATP-binding protein